MKKNNLSRKISRVLKKCKNGDRINEKTIYFRIFIIAIIGSVIVSLPGLEFSIIDYIRIQILLLLLVFVGISSLYFILNEIHKIQSIKALNIAINSLKYSDWHWVKIALLDRPVELHAAVISHPINMYILGQLLLKEGYDEDGNFLILKAREKDKNLEKVQLSPSLSESDAQYFYNSLKIEKRFQRSHSLQQLWNLKVIRYFLIFCFMIFLLLHFLSQILRMM